jgi:hypothetical protein
LMVGGMFMVVAMSYWGDRFTEVGTRSGLLGTIPWCVMAIYSTTWKAVAMAWHKLDWGFGWCQNPRRRLLIDIKCFIMHITSQLFECKHLNVISAILELQFTNYSRKSCLEHPQRNGT